MLLALLFGFYHAKNVLSFHILDNSSNSYNAGDHAKTVSRKIYSNNVNG